MKTSLLYLCFLVTFSGIASNVKSQVPTVDDLASQFRNILKERQPTFVVAYANTFNSFDPLEGDHARNKSVMTLLYATPLEMDEKGNITSSLMNYFSYDESKFTYTFKLKQGLAFSDGTPLAASDVALAFTRILLQSPDYPVIGELKGKVEWLKMATPLKSMPSGIEYDDASGMVRLTFVGKVHEPSFRFMSQNFSIVPGKCVDRLSNKLACSVPPFSGRYALTDNKIGSSGIKAFAPTFLKFEARLEGPWPKVIWFADMSPLRISTYLADYHDQVVVLVNDVNIPQIEQKAIFDRFVVHRTASTGRSFLELNEKSETFKSQRARLFFASEYRKVLREHNIEPEGSFIAPSINGYLSLAELEQGVKLFSDVERTALIQHFKKYPPIWSKGNTSIQQFFSLMFTKTLERLGVPVVAPLEDFESRSWDSGMVSLRLGYCGSWSRDPTGDIRMTFAHGKYPIAHVTSDAKLQQLVAKLDSANKKTHEDVGRYLFEQAKFAVVSSYTTLYLIGNKSDKGLYPVRYTNPQPWFFFADKGKSK